MAHDRGPTDVRATRQVQYGFEPAGGSGQPEGLRLWRPVHLISDTGWLKWMLLL